MKKSELARHLDRMSDYIIENAPNLDTAMVALQGDVPDCVACLVRDALPTEGELAAVRVGVIAGLLYARDVLTGDMAPGDCGADSRHLVSNCLGCIVSERLGINAIFHDVEGGCHE